MGKSYKDKYKRNNIVDKRNKRIKQEKSKFKFSMGDVNKNTTWDDEQFN